MFPLDVWIGGAVLVALIAYALSALLVGWYYSARILVMAHATLMMMGWGLSMFPFVVVPDVTLYNAAAPALVLRQAMIALGIAMAIAIPSFWYLYAVFQVKKNEETEGECDEGSVGLVPRAAKVYIAAWQFSFFHFRRKTSGWFR